MWASMTNMNATVMCVTNGSMMDITQGQRIGHQCRTAAPYTVSKGESHDLSTRRVGSRCQSWTQGARQVALPVHRGHPGRSARRRRRPGVPRSRKVPQAARRWLHQTHQDDDRAGHLLHHRPGHRLHRQGGHRRQGGRAGTGLLRGDVNVRPGHRPRGRQPHPPG